ncbi:MAG: acyl-CoA thioesterase II [Pseudomonadota bacterium]
MTNPTQGLLDLLDIERLEVDLFRGRGDGGETSARIFGGQVIAQALVAAYRTVEDRLCHSLHAYFIRPGDPSIPVIYEVDRSRDGGSFTTRRVIAVQHGKQILNLAASFHKSEDSWTHQHDMPDTPAAETFPTQAELRAAKIERIPEDKRPYYLRERPIEVREVEPMDVFDPEPMSDYNRLWFRVGDRLDQPPWVHHCLLAYASDMSLLGSGNRPHGVSWLQGKHMGASLDHALWFHGEIKFDDWHLYEMDSPFSGGARSFNRGKIFTAEGKLVASVAQEGLMRPIKPKA